MMPSTSENEEEDRLKVIHHHLSTNKSSSNASASWLPLESNPAIFTSYAENTSHLPQTWEFVDVLGFGGGAKDDLLLLSPTESNLSDTGAGAIFLCELHLLQIFRFNFFVETS